MADQNITRKLAAILSIDMVAYSRLMGMDEQGTIARQKAHHEEGAVESLTRRIIRDPKTDISRILLAASYGHLDRIAEARSEWANALRVNPRYSLDYRKHILPYQDSTDFDHLADGLRRADLPPPPYRPRHGDY